MALLPALLLAFTSCSSTPSSSKSNQPTNPAAYADQGSFAGQVVTDSITRTDTVVSIDAALRTIELKHADGKITSYKCGPEVRNFDQIKVGDQVRATVVDEMALFLKPASSMQSISATNMIVGARLGARPGIATPRYAGFHRQGAGDQSLATSGGPPDGGRPDKTGAGRRIRQPGGLQRGRRGGGAPHPGLGGPGRETLIPERNGRRLQPGNRRKELIR